MSFTWRWSLPRTRWSAKFPLRCLFLKTTRLFVFKNKHFWSEFFLNHRCYMLLKLTGSSTNYFAKSNPDQTNCVKTSQSSISTQRSIKLCRTLLLSLYFILISGIVFYSGMISSPIFAILLPVPVFIANIVQFSACLRGVHC